VNGSAPVETWLGIGRGLRGRVHHGVCPRLAAPWGTFLYDIGLDLLALPYILIVGRLLLRQPTFAVHAHEPWGLVPAVIFCSGFLLLVGAGVERAARRLFHRATHKTPPAPTTEA
jgi:hypothetical protein